MSTSNILYLKCAFTTKYYNELCTNGLRKYKVRCIDRENNQYIWVVDETTIFRPNRFYKVSYMGMETALDQWKREYFTLTGIQILSPITHDEFRASSVSKVNTEELKNVCG